jgi:hypothetical protein
MFNVATPIGQLGLPISVEDEGFESFGPADRTRYGSSAATPAVYGLGGPPSALTRAMLVRMRWVCTVSSARCAVSASVWAVTTSR